MGGILDAGVKEAQKQGVKIENLSDPAKRNYNLIRALKTASNKLAHRHQERLLRFVGAV
jgi:hypothetical protein